MSEDVARIVERLRKDHPDPAEREKLYARGLRDYVLVLGIAETDADRVAAAVQAAEDGTVGEDNAG